LTGFSKSRSPCHQLLIKRFPVNFSQIESAITLHKAYDRIELAVYKAALVADDGYAYNSAHFAVIMANLGNGDVESVF